jgi:hypothetical protein
MKPGRHWLPSWGFLLVVLSWTSAAALIQWGLKVPALDRLQWQLARLEMRDKSVASAKLVRRLRESMVRHPALALGLAGPDGARLIEAQRDGWARGPHAHLVLAAERRADDVLVQCRTIGVLELEQDGESLRIPCQPGAAVAYPLPKAWGGKARLVPVKWNGPDGAVRVVGTGIRGAKR